MAWRVIQIRGQLREIFAMAVEAEAEPPGFGGNLGELLQHTQLMSESQGVDGARGEGGIGRGLGLVPLAAQSPPGLEEVADRFGEVGKGRCSRPLRSAAL
jgi:hypothetical protein